MSFVAQKKILMAAGGTGGHIFPALRIAESIQAVDPSVQVEFVHGESALEKDIYSTYSFTCHIFSIGRLRSNISLRERIVTLLSLPVALWKAIRLILKVRPMLVCGAGGAVSGVLVIAAKLLKKKTVIWEPNTIPGLTNKWLSYVVDEAIIVCHGAKSYMRAKKITQLGLPVRAEINAVSVRIKPFTSPLKVLIIGGSQGSTLLNQVVSEMITSYSQAAMSFVHQTGQKDFSILKDRYHGLQSVQVFPFLKEVHQFYDWADVVIGRAGMGMIAELSSARKAAVLIPLASSAGGHQWQNARFLERHSAALLIPQPELTVTKLFNTLESFIHAPQKMYDLACNIHAMQLASSGREVAKCLLSLLQKNVDVDKKH